jgi:hypothetical protein
VINRLTTTIGPSRARLTPGKSDNRKLTHYPKSLYRRLFEDGGQFFPESFQLL